MIIDKKSYALGAANGGGGITPTGTKEITTTDEVNVTTYAKAKVVDENLVAENIREGVEILGVEGGLKLQDDKIVVLKSTDGWEIFPDEGYEGMSELRVTPYFRARFEPITQNGTYNEFTDPQWGEGLFGYSQVEVNVQPNLQAKTATENGVVYPSTGYDGLSRVTVNVPTSDPDLVDITITENGTYTHSGHDGYDNVTVNVSGGDPTLQDKTITANGTYTADDGYDGLGEVQVNVAPHLIVTGVATENRTYYAPGGYDGFASPITVAVPRVVDAWDAAFAFAGPTGEKEAENNGIFANAYEQTGHCASSLIGTFYHCSKEEEDEVSGEDTSPFDMNGSMAIPIHESGFKGMASAFRCSSLKNVPPITHTSTKTPRESEPTYYDLPSLIGHNFERCYWLQRFATSWEGYPELSSDYFHDTPADGASNEFEQCYCLRKIPFKLDKELIKSIDDPSAAYVNRYDCCYSLDEIKVPVKAENGGADMFLDTFTSCSRVNKIVFETYLNGHPKNANWYHAVINLGPDAYGVGYTLWDSVYTDYGSDISADKEVTDDESYEALKNDPDWWTQDIEYSRFNHDSAVALINSLPDCGSTANNEVIFEGASGRKTDGGAIETLTPSEIAVATAKGWSITLE